MFHEPEYLAYGAKWDVAQNAQNAHSPEELSLLACRKYFVEQNFQNETAVQN